MNTGNDSTMLLQAHTRKLEEGLVYADRYINRRYLTNLDVHSALRDMQDREYPYLLIRLFRINKFIYDPNENINDKLISVYGALNTIHSSVIIVIQSDKDGINFYMGTRCEHSDTAGSILENALKGNFGGTNITGMENTQIESIMSGSIMSNSQTKSVASVTLVPSMRGDDKKDFVQGIEKLIDTMSGQSFTAVLISEPMGQNAIELKKRGLEELYAAISPFSETTLAYGNNASYAVAEGTFSSFAESINNSITNSNSETVSDSITEGDSYSSTYSSNSSNQDGSSSSSSGWSSQSGHSSSRTYSSSYGWSNAVTSGTTKTRSDGENTTITNTIGESRTLTVKHVNKSVTDLMKKIDSQLERIRACEAFGLWSCAAYFVSDDIQVCTVAANTFRALIAGDESYMDNAYINRWDGVNSSSVAIVLQSIAIGKHPIIELPRSNMFEAQRVKPAVLVSGKELPLFMSLPRKSVPGLVVDSMASFGRSVFNPYDDGQSKKIEVGSVMHKGAKDSNLRISLDIEEFRAHCFITGSTGSGKSNTTYTLLEKFIDEKINFLVVEPAKGEYKFTFGGLDGVHIFWTLDKQYPLLRLNPFSFPENIHVLEHMDRLIEIFSACWPLYSAMPAILKSAVERSYLSVGWDLRNSIRIPKDSRKFPTFRDLLRELPTVISESEYSTQSKGDYTGALVTRVSSLTNGIMGSVFCSGDEIDSKILFDSNTIIDLSRVGASETKSLLMGILVMKLNEYRINNGVSMNAKLQHVTILEEAHNLLKNDTGPQSSDSANVAGKSVEMISNSIAEMRTYGEGFIIIDQSPTSVDISAIKNTNMKIVMRLPEKSDFEAVGNAFALTDEQIREISRLPRGVAIVNQSGWVEPVMVKIDEAKNTYHSKKQPEVNTMIGNTIAKFIATSLSHAENMSFNEVAVKRFLRNSGVSRNIQERLMMRYRQLQNDCNVLGRLLKDVEAIFVIEAIGCEALVDIYPLNVSKEKEIAANEYIEWCEKIANALDLYGDYGSKSEKIRIAAKLLIYASVYLKKPNYINAQKILKG